MTKKIAITLCAIIVGLSTIFIGQNTVKADTEQEPTTYYSGEINYNINGTLVQGWRFTGSGKATTTFGSPIRINFTNDSYFKGKYYIYFLVNNISPLPGKVRMRTSTNTYEQFNFNSSETVSDNYLSSYYAILNEGYSFISLETSIGTVWKNFDFYVIITSNIEYNKQLPYLYFQGAFNSEYDKGYHNGYNDGMEQSATGVSDIFTGSTVEYNAIYGIDKTYNTTFTPDISGNILSFGSLENAPESLKQANQKEVVDNITIYINTNIPIDIRIFTFTGFPVGTIVTVVGTQENKQSEIQASLITNSNNILYYFSYDYKPSYIFNKISKIIIESKYYTFNNTNSAYKEENYSLYSKFNILSIQPIASLSYNEGYEKGYKQAETEYYNKWYIGRYQQGYNDGTSNAGNYTFLSLMGSVVDAPIKAISNMLNFEILGFNMTQFFYAIITVCIIVTVVKLLL